MDRKAVVATRGGNAAINVFNPPVERNFSRIVQEDER